MAFLIRFRRSFSVFQQLKEKLLSPSVRIDSDLQKKLERLSLLSFQNEDTVKKVEETLRSANKIHEVNVKDLLPLYTLVENEICPLRQSDTVSKERTLTQQEVLQNAANTYEDFLVAPMIGKRDSQTVEKVDTSHL